MKVSQAVDFHLQNHRANSKKNAVTTCGFVLSRFTPPFGKRDLARLSTEEVLMAFFSSKLTYNHSRFCLRIGR